MTPPPPISVALLAAFLACVLVCQALTPPLPDPPPATAEEEQKEGERWGIAPASLPPAPALLALPAAASSGEIVPATGTRRLLSADLVPAKEILSKFEGDKHGRFLLALQNGTVYLMNKSTGSQWKLLIGKPLSISSRDPSIDDGPEYYVYSHKDGNLYEYIKDAGTRPHIWSVEDYVDRTPFFNGSFVTIGSKKSSFYVVRADSGELVYMDNHPYTLSTVRMPTSEVQPVTSKLELSDANYITIVRTDYELLSKDVNKPESHLWEVMVSRINAYNVGLGQPPPVDIEMQMSPIGDPYIPVYILGETGQLSQQVPMLSASSPLQSPKISYRHSNKQNSGALLDAVCGYQTTCLPEAATNSNAETDQTWNRVDNFLGSISSSGLVCDPADRCLLGSCINSGPNSTAVPTDSTGSESRSGSPIELTYYDNNAMSSLQKLSEYANSYSEENRYLAHHYSNSLLNFFSGAFALFTFLLMLIAVLYRKFRNQSNIGKQSNGVKERQSPVPKKRKTRKAGNPRNGALNSNLGKQTLSGKENSKQNAYNQSENNGINSLDNFKRDMDANDGRWVGKLFVSNYEIGQGSNGTVVFEGIHDGRSVAVKRLLRAHNDVALKEIKNLIASDQHPNIVRWHGVEYDMDFVYISLERCICSLSDLIQKCSDSSSDRMYTQFAMPTPLVEHKGNLGFVKGIDNDVILWREKGLPSSQLLKLMRDVVCGLAHLHEIGIIHRDLKPQNVLISKDRCLNAKLSDMGISKRLLDDMSSLSRSATGYGSSGWQAPEQLLHGRQTRAIDLFSLGCILFFCITKGKHPFGNHYDRDSNIVNNRMDLFLVDHIPEAEHLISKLLDPDPKMRPSAVEALHHPLFWSSEMRLSFLRDASDRVELEDRENGSELLRALENTSPAAFGGKWDEKLNTAFISDMGRYRKYKFDSVRDLLRVIRNKLNHYRELPKELQEILGPIPEGFDMYFASRFPNLLIEVYKVICSNCREEDCFSKYFESSLV